MARAFSPPQFRIASLLLLGLFTACAGTGSREASSPSYTDQAGHGYYKIGKPYKINGVWYYPHEDYNYDEQGIASWYGSDFHEQKTANGEVFNKNELTAAHATLPLPTLARVTNLENGRSIVVRINDRGPFHGSRIIDVSQRAAQLLGFEQIGTAKVRVQVLADESKAIADAMRRYGSSNPSGLPSAVPAAAPALAVAQNAGVSPVSSQPLPPPAGYASSNKGLLVKSAPRRTYIRPALQPVESQPHQPAPTASVQLAQQEPLPPLPQNRAEARAMLLTVKPVPEAKQLTLSAGPHAIYVQAGSFSRHENAARLSHRLAKYGRTSIEQAVVRGKKYYRVRVGPSASVADADKLLKRVRRAGADGARIIVD